MKLYTSSSLTDEDFFPLGSILSTLVLYSPSSSLAVLLLWIFNCLIATFEVTSVVRGKYEKHR